MPSKGIDKQNIRILQARALGPFLEIIKDVIKNWSLDYKENYVDILNNKEYVNPNIKSFALLPTYPK